MNLSRFIFSIVLSFPVFAQQDVVVMNPAKDPVLAQLAPAETFVKTFGFNGNSQTPVSLMNVQAKRRLVIETVTVLYRSTSTTQTVYGAFLHATGAQPQVTFQLPVDRSDSIPGAQFPMLAQTLKNVRWYIDPGMALQLEMLTSGSFNLSLTVTISGYFVAVP